MEHFDAIRTLPSQREGSPVKTPERVLQSGHHMIEGQLHDRSPIVTNRNFFLRYPHSAEANFSRWPVLAAGGRTR